jgi:transcriptional regulator with XRE-family HTH domain
MGTVLDDVRTAIDRSEVSRYAISKATGIDQGQLSKLMGGEAGLSIASLERVAEFLGLEIVIRPNRRQKGKK